MWALGPGTSSPFEPSRRLVPALPTRSTIHRGTTFTLALRYVLSPRVHLSFARISRANRRSSESLEAVYGMSKQWGDVWEKSSGVDDVQMRPGGLGLGSVGG